MELPMRFGWFQTNGFSNPQGVCFKPLSVFQGNDLHQLRSGHPGSSLISFGSSIPPTWGKILAQPGSSKPQGWKEDPQNSGTHDDLKFGGGLGLDIANIAISALYSLYMYGCIVYCYWCKFTVRKKTLNYLIPLFGTCFLYINYHLKSIHIQFINISLSVANTCSTTTCAAIGMILFLDGELRSFNPRKVNKSTNFHKQTSQQMLLESQIFLHDLVQTQNHFEA